MIRIHILPILIALMIAGCSGPPQEQPDRFDENLMEQLHIDISQEPSAEQVTRICERLQKIIDLLGADEESRNLLEMGFEPFPAKLQELQPDSAVYLPDFHGVYVPLPEADYRFSVDYSTHVGGFSLFYILPEQKGMLILTRLIDDKPMEDLFQIAGDTTPATEEAKAYTRRLFGKFPNLYDITLTAFTTPASSHQCDKEHLYPAIRDIISYILIKTGGPVSQDLHAYRSIGLRDSILLTGRGAADTQHLRYVYQHQGRYYEFVAVLKGSPAYFSQLIGLIPHISGQQPELPLVATMPKSAADLLDLVRDPSPAKAQALLEAGADASAPRPWVGALERYLKAQEDNP